MYCGASLDAPSEVPSRHRIHLVSTKPQRPMGGAFRRANQWPFPVLPRTQPNPTPNHPLMDEACPCTCALLYVPSWWRTMSDSTSEGGAAGTVPGQPELTPIPILNSDAVVSSGVSV